MLRIFYFKPPITTRSLTFAVRLAKDLLCITAGSIHKASINAATRARSLIALSNKLRGRSAICKLISFKSVMFFHVNRKELRLEMIRLPRSCFFSWSKV